MFGLPTETLFLVFGFPILWLIYLAGFMYVSRDWDDDDVGSDRP